ncbi:hypothetical protein E2C01_075929 [Portunus trituberculatus]|uniref:Uncharacterized protein n=1 Tax=Portunus trituberculatus TaxID=210409 RepID=A0A5B7IBX5_PORTR|nr:hypothetical protein [Portunus trituberculatus]
MFGAVLELRGNREHVDREASVRALAGGVWALFLPSLPFPPSPSRSHRGLTLSLQPHCHTLPPLARSCVRAAYVRKFPLVPASSRCQSLHKPS